MSVTIHILEKPECFDYSRQRSDIKKYGLKNDIIDEELKKAYDIVSEYDEKYLKDE